MPNHKRVLLGLAVLVAKLVPVASALAERVDNYRNEAHAIVRAERSVPDDELAER